MVRKNSLSRTFILGTLCGILSTSVWLLFSSWIVDEEKAPYNRVEEELHRNDLNPYYGLVHNTDQSEHLTSNSIEHLKTPDAASGREFEQNPQHRYKKNGEEEACEMADKVRVMCWIATMPENHKTKAVMIRDTWGKRCNILLFMSTKNESSLPAIALPVQEGREHLFDKTKAAMTYIYQNYIESVDWILKADDDTFVVVENLRYLLSKYNSSNAFYLGCRFKPFTRQGFMSGGAGYVLSRAALKRFVEEAVPDKDKCRQSGTGDGEDVEMGKCMEKVNVTAVDTRDSFSRGRFFPYGPEFHLFPDHYSQQYEWYWKYQYYPDPEGLNCCSNTAVSFHYITPGELRVLDYLVHTLRLYSTSVYYYNETTYKTQI